MSLPERLVVERSYPQPRGVRNIFPLRLSDSLTPTARRPAIASKSWTPPRPVAARSQFVARVAGA